ncbi:MAG: DUF1330 domain-containing protein [Alphaproteobacteria bacterium]|nr:DUF1330 domain-containing protein [Alphaproteobacteria bacterium]
MRRALVKTLSGALAACALAACATQGAVAPPPAEKGYIIAEISVTDPAAYEAYKAAVGPMVARFGGRYLVRGGQTTPKEGAAPSGRVVVLEFESYAAAQIFYDSSAYQAILPLRTRNATSRIFIVEGFAPAP